MQYRLVKVGALLMALFIIVLGVQACEKKAGGRQGGNASGQQTTTETGQTGMAAEADTGRAARGGAGGETEGSSAAGATGQRAGAVPVGAEGAGAAAGAAGGTNTPANTAGSSTAEKAAGGTSEKAGGTAGGKAGTPAAAKEGNFKYVGVTACAMCHRGPSKGSIYEVWQASDHAKAYENLGAENQKNEVCLGCHTTGHGKALAANVTPDKMVNVQCEACHGPGSEYKAMAIMKNRPQALEKGLVLPTKEVCMGCHGGKFPEGHPTVAFNYESALLKIEHHSKPTEKAPAK